MIKVGKAVLVQAVKHWHCQVYLKFQRMFPLCVTFRFVFIETSMSLVSCCCSSICMYHPSLVCVCVCAQMHERHAEAATPSCGHSPNVFK